MSTVRIALLRKRIPHRTRRLPRLLPACLRFVKSRTLASSLSLAALSLFAMVVANRPASAAEPLEIRQGDSIAIVGNALPWRCHRRIIADALIVRGWSVKDIMSPTQTKDHALTDFAEVDGERITYP